MKKVVYMIQNVDAYNTKFETKGSMNEYNFQGITEI